VEQTVGKRGSNGERRGRVVLLYCHRTLRDGQSLAGTADASPGLQVQPVAISCGASIEVRRLLEILADGAAAVEVVTCPEGYCESLLGSRRAAKRVEYARQLLEEVGVDAERIGHRRASRATAAELVESAIGRWEGALAAKAGRAAEGEEK
jgi:coenzyme F420-reducing hydrogenase delta subunit